IRNNFKLMIADSNIQPDNLNFGDGQDIHNLKVNLAYAIDDLSAVQIKNTLLFNLYDDMQNIHQWTSTDGSIKMAVATLDDPLLNISLVQESGNGNDWQIAGKFLGYFWMAGVLFLSLYQSLKQGRNLL
ncbi:MAG: hypothetical protein KDC80_19750, partial [Saprospiraceae bacterium]|nr:hypothetical protein [Saprospiraceae bacterium]